MGNSRRDILKLLGVSAASLALTIDKVSAQTGSDGDILDVAIIGAGAAGLTAGFLLDQAGANFRIFEADNRYGGRAFKREGFADFPLDLGGEWIHTNSRVLNKLSGQSDVESLATEYLPMTSDVWDGEKLYSENRYAKGWRNEYRFIDTTWFDFFDAYMAQGILDRISLNSIVTEIDCRSDISRVQLATGETIRARHVIVTVPLNVLKDGDIRFTPDLSDRKKRALQGAIMPDGFKLFLRMSDQFYPDLVLFDHGYETPESEIMFYNVSLDKPTNQNILGFFGHGALATPYVQMSEADMVKAALDLLDQLYDGVATPAYEDHLLQNWSQSPFPRGTYSFFDGASPRTLGRPIDGRIHFAGEAYNQRFDGEWGYMHVAARSAYDAVKQIGG
ncbi:MAG: NAD(P)/FAD-dependent oxidoreductase [Pseudomonadota bacterium]